jgi:hypothetical protein
MHLIHCYHNILDSELVLKRKSKCKKNTENVFKNGYALVKIKKQCCICNKIKTFIYEDYDPDRVRNYSFEK